jgi:hypothetical protein
MVDLGSVADLEAVRAALEELRVPREPRASGEVPAPEVEWPILVTFDAPIESARLLEAFGDDWWDEHDAVLYALPPKGAWARVGSEPEPDVWQAIQIAMRLPGDAEPRTELGLNSVLADVSRRATALGALLTEARYPVESAAVRAADLRRLRDFVETCDDGCLHLRVVNSDGYRGADVERVLVHAGFDARRGGLFALSNDGDCIGDELIMGAALEHETRLTLWFAVPRVAEPFAVLDGMVAVAALVVSTLGGEIVDEQGARANVLVLRANVADLVERMMAANLVPGATGLALV